MSKNIYTIISECVTNLRKVCTITSVTNVGTTYTFNTRNLNGIAVGLYVNFGTTKNYIVTEILENRYFKVVSSEDLSTKTSASIACAFIYGSGNEITAIVTEKGNSNDYKYINYPLIALRVNDIKERKVMNVEVEGVEIWIFLNTPKTIRTEARNTGYLILTLNPYYVLFRNELIKHKSVIMTEKDVNDNETKENLFLTGALNDTCDAIRLTYSKINIKS